MTQGVPLNKVRERFLEFLVLNKSRGGQDRSCTTLALGQADLIRQASVVDTPAETEAVSELFDCVS